MLLLLFFSDRKYKKLSAHEKVLLFWGRGRLFLEIAKEGSA